MKLVGSTVMTTFEEISRRKIDLLRAAANQKARKLRVFGSVARSEERPDSDVDFLMDFDAVASLLDLLGFQRDNEALLGRCADVVTADGVSPFLRQRILAEARAL